MNLDKLADNRLQVGDADEGAPVQRSSFQVCKPAIKLDELEKRAVGKVWNKSERAGEVRFDRSIRSHPDEVGRRGRRLGSTG